MHCPLCVDVHLDITHHGGIEVDICPRCRGIWLDRGELDRLVSDRPVDRSLDRGADRTPAPADVTGGGRDEPGRDRAGSPRPGSDRRTGRPRTRRLAERLGDVLDEVLDL